MAKVQEYNSASHSSNSFYDGFAKSFDVLRPIYSDTDLQLQATEEEELVANSTSWRLNERYIFQLIESLYIHIYKVERAGNCAMNFLIIIEESIAFRLSSRAIMRAL